MTRGIKIGVAVVFVIPLASWFYYTPYLAVKNLRLAAENKDPVALSRYVNFPAVRESLRAGINAKMMSEIAKTDHKKNPFAGLGAALMMAFAGPLIDAMITPEGMAMLMKGERPAPEKKKQAAVPTSGQSEVETETSMGYEGFDEFVVRTKRAGSTDDPVVLVFQRDGLISWKLSAIHLPW